MDTKKILCKNKKVQFDYFIEKEYEAGLVLQGWEVKSLMLGKANLVDSFVKEINGELFLVGCNIQNLPTLNTHSQYDNVRFKKLLMHKKEIHSILGNINKKGYTLMCNSIYISDRKIKANLCLCKGKKNYDKRQSEKEKDIKMNLNRQTFNEI